MGAGIEGAESPFSHRGACIAPYMQHTGEQRRSEKRTMWNLEESANPSSHKMVEEKESLCPAWKAEIFSPTQKFKWVWVYFTVHINFCWRTKASPGGAVWHGSSPPWEVPAVLPSNRALLQLVRSLVCGNSLTSVIFRTGLMSLNMITEAAV